jgi:hypothetical protein
MKILKFLMIIGALLVLPTICQAKIIKDMPVPLGYVRVEYADSSYSAWIQRLPLKEDNVILGYNGKPIISPFYNILAVVDMPMLFNQDLEQCADWCFRFRAEYFKQTGRLEQLYLFDYSGKHRYYRYSGKPYKGFLKWALGNANSYSVKKGCQSVDEINLRPGDMLVQNKTGGVGHVSVVMDVCQDGKGDQRYLIGYSFMPAQQFHLEKAGADQGREGWFTLAGYREYLRKHFYFGEPAYRRF